jgi:hypothetical protein
MLPRSAFAASAHETIEALEAELAEAETHLRNVLSKQPAAATPTSGGEACAQKCARLAAELERATMEFASRLHAEQVRAESVGRAGGFACRSEDLGWGGLFIGPRRGCTRLRLRLSSVLAAAAARSGRTGVASRDWPVGRGPTGSRRKKKRDMRRRDAQQLPPARQRGRVGLFGLCRPRPRGCAMSSHWRS